MTDRGTATNVKVGPGKLFFAEVNATEPDDLTAPWGASWILMGYTDDGHAFNNEPKFDGLEVAEEYVPIRYEQSSSELSVEFDLAEITAKNIQKAFNGGTITTGTGTVTFEPPAPGTPAVRVAIGWESEDGSERWIWRKCLQTGKSAIARKKAPKKTVIPMSFVLEKVPNKQPFKAIFATEV